MKIIQSVAQMVLTMQDFRSKNKSIGFVPTMGALHEGHLALVRKSISENDITVVSIFVNPLQFNNPDDFLKYPKMPEKDRLMLENEGCDVLFTPVKDEIFPPEYKKSFQLGYWDTVMEGAFRPGHFQGVARVVYRLFEIIQPQRAYFGLKDYQQFMIISRVVAPYFQDLKILGLETVREKSGLALSSRNLRLTPKQYSQASQVPELLKKAADMLGKKTLQEIKEWFKAELSKYSELRPEYLEFAHADTLQPFVEGDTPSKYRVFVSFYAGEVRLIDNMAVQ
ncbi:MAG: pantoate--beta-alanine ligase [Flavobacteriales bacterium]|nr:pantoate--beta-alanine ligase [Flavobacteriales bacterium]